MTIRYWFSSCGEAVGGRRGREGVRSMGEDTYSRRRTEHDVFGAQIASHPRRARHRRNRGCLGRCRRRPRCACAGRVFWAHRRRRHRCSAGRCCCPCCSSCVAASYAACLVLFRFRALRHRGFRRPQSWLRCRAVQSAGQRRLRGRSRRRPPQPRPLLEALPPGRLRHRVVPRSSVQAVR